MTKPVYILNGPSLDMLGTREPEIYGSDTLGDIEAMCQNRARELGLEIVFRQSHREGELVEWILEAREAACGIILNAAAYTHSSVALMDAIISSELPVVEVHLSNLFKREKFRHHSFITPVAVGMICGFGASGYLLALEGLNKKLNG